MPALLNKTADAVLQKIRRSPLYYRRYNNTLAFGVNRAYVSYAAECRKLYEKQHGPVTLPPSPMFANAAERLKGAFPRDKAEAYSTQITKFIETNDPCVDRPEKFSDLQVRIEQPLKNLGTGLLDVLRSPDVAKSLLSFFRSHYRIEWVTVYRSLPAERKASSWLWHSDSYPPHTCKVFLHLTPATAETGATEFMNLEDTMAYRKAGYFGQYLGERYDSLESFAKEHGIPHRPYHFDAEPGDATLFDMNFFHRAVSPRKDFRDVVQFFLVPNPVSWDEQLAKDGLDSLNHVGSGYAKDPRRG